MQNAQEKPKAKELIECDGQSEVMSDCIKLLGQLAEAISGEVPQPALFTLLCDISELKQSLDRISQYQGRRDKDKLKQLTVTIGRCVLKIQSHGAKISSINSGSTPIRTSKLQAAAEVYDAIVKANQLLLTLQASSPGDSTGKKDTEKNKEDNPFRQYINTRNSYSSKMVMKLADLETDFNASCARLQEVVQQNTMKFSSKSEHDIQDEAAVQNLSLNVKKSKEPLLALMGSIENIQRNEVLDEKLEYLRLRLQCVDMALDYLKLHPVSTQSTFFGVMKSVIGDGDGHDKQPLWSMLLCSPHWLYIRLAEMFRPSILKNPIALLGQVVLNPKLFSAYRSFHLFMVAALFVLKDESKTAEDKQKKLIVEGLPSSMLVCLLRRLNFGNLKRLNPDDCVLSDTVLNVSNEKKFEVRRGWVNANSDSYIHTVFQQVSTAVDLDSDDHSFLLYK